MDWHCEICDNYFEEKEILEDHMNLMHCSVSDVGCRECLQLTGETEKHKKQLLFPYNICGQTVDEHVESQAKNLVCQVCDETFSNEPSLESHLVKSHSVELSHECERCGAKFVTVSALSDHLTVVHKQKPEEKILCHVCKKKIKRTYFDRHLENHQRERSIVCHICNKSFSYRPSLKSHLLKFHAVELTFDCELCGMKFGMTSELSKHMIVVHEKPPEERVQCPVCQRSVLKRTLDKHVEKHQKGKIYVCQVCNKKFINKISFTYHARHAHVTERPHECGQCGKKFVSSAGLRNHSSIHSGKKRYTCDICSKKFTRSDSVRRHVKLLHRAGSLSYQRQEQHQNKNKRTVAVSPGSNGKLPEVVQCEKCGKMMKRARLYSHLKNHTLDEANVRPFPCNVCGAAFKSRKHLGWHAVVHSNETPYLCNLCGKRFKEMSRLKSHWVMHRDDKPYSCSFCQKAFSRKLSLRRHLDVHSNEKKHVCTVCDRRFTLRGTLKVHMRTHTKEKPFSCNICGKTAAHQVSLKNHVCLISNEPQDDTFTFQY